MADIVYHLPVLPTQPTHVDSNDENRRIFSAAVRSNLGASQGDSIDRPGKTAQ
jgi:hypothetical protein